MQETLEKDIALDQDRYTVGQLAQILGFPSRNSVYYLLDHLGITLMQQSSRKSYIAQADARRIVDHVQGKRVSDADRRMVRQTTEHVLWGQERKIEEKRKEARSLSPS